MCDVFLCCSVCVRVFFVLCLLLFVSFYLLFWVCLQCPLRMSVFVFVLCLNA